MKFYSKFLNSIINDYLSFTEIVIFYIYSSSCIIKGQYR